MPITPSGAQVWRDFVTDGVPASGAHKVLKNQVRAWSQSVESVLDSVLTAAAIFDTRTNLFATLTYAANTLAWVVADSTAAYNGIYRKSGASGAGSWARVADLPYSFVVASDVGAGTPNAIQATSSIPISESAIVILNVFEANTGSPVTVAFNGGSALTVKTNTGNDVSAGGLVAGMRVLGVVSGSTFRLVNDQVSSAIVAAAEAAQTAAEAAAADALASAAGVDLPPVAPNSMLVDNAAGTVRESKTFAEVRSLLDVPDFETLPFIMAWENGVPGDGSDQTAALQALIDALPASGGNILIKGEVLADHLNLLNRRYIRIAGLASIGTGSANQSILRLTRPAGGGATDVAVDLRGTNSVGFERMYIVGMDTGFTGSLLKYGLGTSEAVYPFLNDVMLQARGTASGAGLDLRQSTQGAFRRVSFRGSAKHIMGMDSSVGMFSNIHKFEVCSFNPVNQYPVYWPGENWFFDSCNVQAGSEDGAGRFITGATNARFKNLTLKNCTMYDVLVAGGSNTIWLANMYGQLLTVEDCLFGAQAGAYGIQPVGTQGLRVKGNRMGFGGALVLPASDGATKAGGGEITGNVIHNQNLLHNTTNLDLAKTDVFGNLNTGTGTVQFNRATA